MIYIVIAVFNRLSATLECFTCIKQQVYKNYQVILIDDGSTDGTADTIKQLYPETIILKGDGNLWWTGAMYKGVEYALTKAQNDDYILSLNNDVTFAPDYLEHLVNSSKTYNQAVVGSLCKDVLNHERILDAGIKMQWKKYIYSQKKYQPEIDVITDIDTISGRGVLIPISVIKKIGNFAQDKLPHYGADYEFGFRARAAGIPLVISNKAIVYLKDDLTGFRPTAKILSYKDTWKRLFSIKSPANIIVNLKIIYLHCPSFGTKIYDILYLIAGNFYIALRDIIMYTLIKLHFINLKNNG